MGSEPIRSDEWLQELARLSARNDDGVSLAEMAEEAGVSDKTMRERLKKAQRLGWVTVGKRASVGLAGRACWVPVYRVEVPK